MSQYQSSFTENKNGNASFAEMNNVNRQQFYKEEFDYTKPNSFDRFFSEKRYKLVKSSQELDALYRDRAANNIYSHKYFNFH